MNSAISRVQQDLPPTAKITTNRLTFATFPILGYSLTTSNPRSRNQTLGISDVYAEATAKPRQRCGTVTVQGGQVPEFHVVPNLAQLQASGVTVLDLANAIGAANMIDSPGLYEEDTNWSSRSSAHRPMAWTT